MLRRRALTPIFYNAAPPSPTRGSRELAREIRALLSLRPEVLGLAETIGYHLPAVPGYVLLRDTSRPGRSNVAAYVRADLYVEGSERWHDLTTEWKRWDHPGMHPARSALEFRIGHGVQVVVYHAPPLGIRDAHGAPIAASAQREGLNLLTRRLAPERREGFSLRAARARLRALAAPRIVLQDANRDPSAPATVPGPAALAAAIGGRVVGDKIDNAVVRRALVVFASYPRRVAGVLLRTDHGHAFRFRVKVARRWLP